MTTIVRLSLTSNCQTNDPCFLEIESEGQKISQSFPYNSYNLLKSIKHPLEALQNSENETYPDQNPFPLEGEESYVQISFNFQDDTQTIKIHAQEGPQTFEEEFDAAEFERLSLEIIQVIFGELALLKETATNKNP